MGMVGDGDAPSRGWMDGDEVSQGVGLGMELILAGTVGDGDHFSTPCSSLINLNLWSTLNAFSNETERDSVEMSMGTYS
jgi:hypothetical protein